MTLFVIITNKLYFSHEIIKYFKTQNMCNTFNFVFLPIGLDQGSEKEILKIINDRVNELKKIEVVVVFSDAGLSTKLAKQINLENPEIKLFRSKGSLIENGYLTYIMSNTKVPTQIVEQIINENIDKE